MAKRKTSRQIAASRRNIRKAQVASARKRRGLSKAGVLKAGVAIGAVYGGTVVARKVYNRNHVYAYHSTNREAHDAIKRQGFKNGHDYVGSGGTVYFSTHRQKNYGSSVIKLRIPKVDFRKHARRDPLAMKGHENYYTMDAKHANRYSRRR